MNIKRLVHSKSLRPTRSYRQTITWKVLAKRTKTQRNGDAHKGTFIVREVTSSLILAALPAGGDSGDRVPGKLDEFVEGRFRKTLHIAVGAVVHAVGIGHGGPDAIGLNSVGAKPRHV